MHLKGLFLDLKFPVYGKSMGNPCDINHWILLLCGVKWVRYNPMNSHIKLWKKDEENSLKKRKETVIEKKEGNSGEKSRRKLCIKEGGNSEKKENPDYF